MRERPHWLDYNSLLWGSKAGLGCCSCCFTLRHACWCCRSLGAALFHRCIICTVPAGLSTRLHPHALLPLSLRTPADSVPELSSLQLCARVCVGSTSLPLFCNPYISPALPSADPQHPRLSTSLRSLARNPHAPAPHQCAGQHIQIRRPEYLQTAVRPCLPFCHPGATAALVRVLWCLQRQRYRSLSHVLRGCVLYLYLQHPDLPHSPTYQSLSPSLSRLVNNLQLQLDLTHVKPLPSTDITIPLSLS